jgi:histidinol dehydrogenase
MAITSAGPLRRDDWANMDRSARDAWARGLRAPTQDPDVAAIVARVRRDGDIALRELTLEIDGVDLDDLFVPESDLASAQVPAELRAALEASAAAVRRYHADQRAALSTKRPVRTGTGVTAWRRWQPIERAGGYVPGGLASYPSSVIMLGIPAALASVDQLIMATPPRPDGSVDPAVLVAARLAGVARVLRVGGAQAIAALAYGTESVPRVDRIFGAGNAWVTAAKRLVAADTAIDLPAGPSELAIVADAASDPDLIAADLLAQAEHGPDSLAILVTDAPVLADRVEAALVRQSTPLATGNRAMETLRVWGRVVLVPDLDAGLDAVNAVAAEHVSLQCADAEPRSEGVRHAGAIFIGPWSAVAAGDYASGANHILPTGGAARAYGGLSVESFGRWIGVQRVSSTGARQLAPIVGTIAAAEGLPAHVASMQLRAERAADEAPDDPVELLRRPGPVLAYPAEPSNDDLAAQIGLPVAQIARYDLNTLGGGPLPGAVAGLAAYDTRRAGEYGDMAYRRLRAALSEHVGVRPEQIVPGAGADELIRLLTTAAFSDGDAAVLPTPTFGMFAVETSLAGGRVVELPRRDLASRQTVPQLRAAAAGAAARLVWLCTPNNPTGDRYPLAEIRELATGLPALVVVDEVYLEFAEADTGEPPNSESAVNLQSELPNVLVLRSLSKAYGLAGTRIGYLVVPLPLAARFDAIRLPLSVAAPSEAMALGALADEPAAVARRRQMIAQRRRLEEALRRLGCEALPSVTNFVAFRPPDASALASALLARGLVLREYDGGPMAGWLRAGARDAAGTGRLIAALEELLA